MMFNKIKLGLLAFFLGLLAFSTHFQAQTIVNSFKMVSLQSPASFSSKATANVFFLAASMEVQESGSESGSSLINVLALDPTLKPYFYPSPFYLESGSTLGYELAQDMDIEVRIYNLFGNEVFRQSYLAGTQGGLGHSGHQFYNKIAFTKESFRGVDMPSGVYLFVLINNGKVIQKGKFAIRPGRAN
jgi:hypothetical protein